MGNLQKTKNLILNFNGESKYQQLQKSLFPLNLSTICPIDRPYSHQSSKF